MFIMVNHEDIYVVGDDEKCPEFYTGTHYRFSIYNVVAIYNQLFHKSGLDENARQLITKLKLGGFHCLTDNDLKHIHDTLKRWHHFETTN